MKENEGACVIGHVTVKDSEKWAEYRSKMPATLAPWGGDLVLRGTRGTVLCGEHNHTDVVVIRFPDVESVSGWYNSPDYQALIPVRTQAADVVLVSYESATG